MSLTVDVEVFKAGTQTAADGSTRDWTLDDLDTIIAEYSSRSEADLSPVVLGHPSTDAPAYGWVAGLHRSGSTLVATLKDMTDEFVSWVRAGLYKNRSVSLNLNNLSLNHVGFLGGTPPAVKGLAVPQFSDGTDSVTVEFGADESLSTTNTISNNSQEGTPEMDEQDVQTPDTGVSPIDEFLQAVSADLTSRLSADVAAVAMEVIAGHIDVLNKLIEPKEEADEPDEETKTEETGEPAPEEKAPSSEFAQLQAQNTELLNKIAALETAGRRSDNTNYFNGLLQGNKVLPKQKDLILNALEAVQNPKADFASNGGSDKIIKDLIESFGAIAPTANNDFAQDGQTSDKYEAIRNFAKERNKQ